MNHNFLVRLAQRVDSLWGKKNTKKRISTPKESSSSNALRERASIRALKIPNLSFGDRVKLIN